MGDHDVDVQIMRYQSSPMLQSLLITPKLQT